ncbi:DDHD domain-containing protein [Hypoxylon sp. FL1284]|nr:DDHD domain-containing protein [Hypoxylon sp. FL1284]
MPPTSFINCGELPKTHNYGSTCRLAPVSHPASSSDADDIPPVNAQYFYLSSIPIDDPLSTTVAATTDPRTARSGFRPFSPGDNNALEKAWLSLASDAYRENHTNARQNRPPSPSLAKTNGDKLQSIVRQLAVQHAEKHAREGPSREKVQPFDEALPEPDAATPLCCPDLLVDAGIALRSSFCAVARRKQHELNRDMVAQAVMSEMNTLHTDSTASVTRRDARSSSIPPSQSKVDDLMRSGQSEESPNSRPSTAVPESPIPNHNLSTERSISVSVPTRTSLVDDGISGRPFVRVETAESPITSPPPSLPRAATISRPGKPTEEARNGEVEHPRPASGANRPSTPRPVEAPKTLSREVTVGVSRLHEVSLPALQMKPIYWSPVNDIATVLRATWFYRDDMRPLDSAVANQLEAGYRELKPHTETWNDELRCAVEVGPLGEEKVSHALWPKPLGKSSKKTDEPVEPPISSNPFCAARCFRGEAAAEGSLILTANEDNSAPASTHKKFEQYHVIYKNETTAYLLKPSLKPSAYYGRRPVAKIMRGLTVGIPVVRGFDFEAWMNKHEKKQHKQHEQQVPAGGIPRQTASHGACLACRADEERARVTDLVLVVHGIGQKLAERVENYHFTHAINAFRRAINIELRNDAVGGALREGQHGIMVLPVNWRQNLSFEDGGPMKEEDKENYTPGEFTLKDIEPKTIPAVRSMISDVMFDIPFYMSHHKPKMVAAMVGEANRVYRLWCRNNPGFSQNGRVHLIGHSLGSVMCIEVLSRQPNTTPVPSLSKPIQLKHFDFDTKNLFLIGSPAAFFLLLERGALLPRRGRLKPGADPSDVVSTDVVGEAGRFGCIAVDNIYNILAREDAVAYLLNGTLDPMYAASLKTAYVPSTSMSLLQSMGSAMRSIVPGASAAPVSVMSDEHTRPSALRLPSQLELEVHDFSREEIAERKAFLLNDNGQIDYFLRSGSGPLELQYLNMLSAHTSYWVNHDLIRMLCLEIGRKPGRAHTLPSMRAVKATKRVVPRTV